ncbi:hypothetical protein KXS11_10395 [Plantibacter flavus]|uniref:hypothetical protein n=1 Tax=Plantibacter flavus TaxID=150123 RepID=UPI003F184890
MNGPRHLYQPGEIDTIRSGDIFVFDISGALLSGFLALIAIPSLMVLLSLTLPALVNRATNLVVAGVFIPVCVFNAAGASSPTRTRNRWSCCAATCS